MPRFSASLGFLWPDDGLCDSILAASRAGFDGVECHWPYAVSADDVRFALVEAGVPMLLINTRPGDVTAGEFGLTAVPGRQKQAREFIDESLEYADQIRSRFVHVMAGRTDGGDTAQQTYVENLNYACREASKRDIVVLIEPINKRDVPGYHLATLDAAAKTLKAVNHGSLKLLFDCYHLQIMQGDIINSIKSCFDNIGHVQFASVPDRAEPDEGELNYRYIFEAMTRMGYKGYFGAEYKPTCRTADHLGWLDTLKKMDI